MRETRYKQARKENIDTQPGNLLESDVTCACACHIVRHIRADAGVGVEGLARSLQGQTWRQRSAHGRPLQTRGPAPAGWVTIAAAKLTPQFAGFCLISPGCRHGFSADPGFTIVTCTPLPSVVQGRATPAYQWSRSPCVLLSHLYARCGCEPACRYDY